MNKPDAATVVAIIVAIVIAVLYVITMTHRSCGQ